MTGRKATMDNLGTNPGERAEAARKRRFQMMIALYVVVAVLIIVGTLVFKRAGHQLAPGWAIACTILYLGLALFVGLRMCRVDDEVEIRANMMAMAWAGSFYGLAYPVWYFLWRGGLVPEPDHMLMYVATVAVATVTYLARKIS